MKPVTLCLRLATALMMVLSCVHCLLAQDKNDDLSNASIEQLANIEVYTASRHVQAMEDAPSSVTVIYADQIQEHGYRTLGEVLQSVRGFFVTNDRNYSSLGVRGFARPGDYNTRILLLIDGHRLNDNVYDEAMIGTELPLDIDLIDRIEVIRGPASSLYGSNAFFATINIITMRGGNLQGVELSAEAGSFNTYKSRVSYGGRLKDVDLLISGTFQSSRGHKSLFFSEFNSPETNNGIAVDMDQDEAGSSLISASFRNFTVQGLYGTREKTIPTGAYGVIFNDPRTRTRDSHAYVDLRYERSLAGTSLIARTFYDRYTYQGIYAYPSEADDGRVTPNLDFSDGKWWGLELQVARTIWSRNRITAGGEIRDNIRQNQTNYNVDPYELLLADRRESLVGAAFLQDEILITRRLSANVGVRYDHYSNISSSINPRGAMVYRPRNSTALKFIYGEAFRAPNVYELYYSIAPNLPNPALGPERIRDAELAWEQVISKHVWLSASAFHQEIEGLITEQPVDEEFLQFRNLQSARSNGVEFELRTQLASGLEGGASYSLQQTKDSTTEELLSNSPRTLVKLNLSQPCLRRRVVVSADVQYRSRIQPIVGESLSSATTVALALLARRVHKRLDVSAGIYNLLDKKYFDPPSAANIRQPIEQDGRSFRVKLTWQLGKR